jgi:hypothetical protein
MKCRDNNMWTKCIARLAPMLALIAILGSPDLAVSATIHADSDCRATASEVITRPPDPAAAEPLWRIEH